MKFNLLGMLNIPFFTILLSLAMKGLIDYLLLDTKGEVNVKPYLRKYLRFEL
jgi:hypothetical protein